MTLQRAWAAVLGVLGVLWAATIWAWPDAVFALCFDDSYYYLEIARNVAEGHGSTFDRLNPTNGYHPGWMLALVPLFAAGLDGLLAVRVMLTIQVGLWMVLLWLIGGIVLRAGWEGPGARWAWSATGGVAVGLVAGPVAVKTIVNGMESALYAVCWGGLLVLSDRAGGRLLSGTTGGQRALAAGLGCAAFLARTDAVFLLLCLGLWTLPDLRRLDAAAGIGRLVTVFLPPALLIASYMAFNWWWLGTPTQVSGDLKRVPPDLVRGVVIVVSLAAPLLVLAGARRVTAFPRVRAALGRTGWFLCFIGIVVAYYCGVQTFPRLWYFGPVLGYASVLACLGTLDLCAQALAEAPDKTPGRALGPLVGVLVVPLVAGVLYQGSTVGDPAFTAIRWKAVEAAAWIDENLPPDAVVGSWDAGVVGYFADRRIVNLDGVVNAPEYIEALRQGTAGERLRGQGVRWVVNHGGLVDGDSPDVRPLVDGIFGGGQVVEVWPFTFTGSTNRTSAGTYEMAVVLYALP